MPAKCQRPRRHLALLVPLALAALTLAAGPALAQPLACGDTVTQDTTLNADLVGCAGDGLAIGADGITLDLGGHTISGRFISGGTPGQVGIDNHGHDDVTIRNGTVNGFVGGGVHLVGTDGNRVEGLTMQFPGDYGILLEGGGSANHFNANTIDRATSFGIGIYGVTAASRDNQVRGNAVTDAEDAGIALRYGTISATTIEDNTVNGITARDLWGAAIAVGARYTSGEGSYRGTVLRGNRTDTTFGGGFFVADAATDTLVERNHADDAYGTPAFESDGDRTVVRGNRVTSEAFAGSTETGVQVDQNAGGNRVEGNSIDRAGLVGVDDSGTGTLTTANVIVGQVFPSELITGFVGGIIARPEASRGSIVANVVRRQSPGFSETVGGIVVDGDDFTVRGNLVDQIDLHDGILVAASATGTRVLANVTTRNGDDGIDVESPATTVTANLANDNTDLGIEAVAGVTDGGGNRAHGNGNPAQCVGVTCS